MLRPPLCVRRCLSRLGCAVLHVEASPRRLTFVELHHDRRLVADRPAVVTRRNDEDVTCADVELLAALEFDVHRA